eukprot:8409882-Pyramimonas_sp.AAC.1
MGADGVGVEVRREVHRPTRSPAKKQTKLKLNARLMQNVTVTDALSWLWTDSNCHRLAGRRAEGHDVSEDGVQKVKPVLRELRGARTSGPGGPI